MLSQVRCSSDSTSRHCCAERRPEQLLGFRGRQGAGAGQDPRVAVQVDGILREVVGELTLRKRAGDQALDERQGVDGCKVRVGVLPQLRCEAAWRGPAGGGGSGGPDRCRPPPPARSDAASAPASQGFTSRSAASQSPSLRLDRGHGGGQGAAGAVAVPRRHPRPRDFHHVRGQQPAGSPGRPGTPAPAGGRP